MGRLWLAIRAFFRVLFEANTADSVKTVLLAGGSPVPSPGDAPQQPRERTPKALPARSEALTLLATLQREARLVDFIQEPIDAYSDAQVGAAVREVHRKCAALLDRHFALAPVLQDREGSRVEVPSSFDAARFRLTGNVVGEPPHRGKLVHHGWQAAKCELPVWTGTSESSRIVSPAEVEVE